MKKGFLNAKPDEETKLNKLNKEEDKKADENTSPKPSNEEPVVSSPKECDNAKQASSPPGQNIAGSPQKIVRVKITRVAPKDAPSRIPTTPPPPPPPPPPLRALDAHLLTLRGLATVTVNPHLYPARAAGTPDTPS
mmetsp:Transcript_28745/g.68672  ORF Transcript_28745/g.68672 Transcript_28745/m.68672 type:complete len:136 (+) Transcript_28745:119-526(+)